jgi:hypothetical protein
MATVSASTLLVAPRTVAASLRRSSACALVSRISRPTPSAELQLLSGKSECLRRGQNSASSSRSIIAMVSATNVCCIFLVLLCLSLSALFCCHFDGSCCLEFKDIAFLFSIAVTRRHVLKG